MSGPLIALQVTLGLFLVGFLVSWFRLGRPQADDDRGWPRPGELGVGFVTNFFDTLGIGSFAPTTALYRLFRLVPDERIPGTLNVGHTPATVAQAFIFTTLVDVEFTTLAVLIAAAVLGAWLGAGVVAGWPRRRIQFGMGIALLVAAVLFTLTNLGIVAGGGTATGLSGGLLAAAAAGNFVLGALMTLGIGLYGPCLIMISLLGMNPKVAFPIMMGSCAFLMVVAGIRFLKAGAYRQRASLGLTLGGIPAVLIAAFIVKSLDLANVRWLVAAVVTYTGVTMLWSATRSTRTAAGAEQ
ncbi:MAG: sulfite exporter TauE/SafE family protein [Gemmatimonadales bacterium]|nr:sulfite exporter TauE/SafE family protein [Gemmatimonadales bacterium]